MKAMLARLRQATTLSVLSMVLLGVVGPQQLGGAGTLRGWAIGGLLVMVIAAVKYPWSARTVSHDEVVPPLLRSGARYCLVLRPFGQDARIVLPKPNRKGRP